MQYPKDLFLWECAPGRRLAQFVLTLKNVKGALAQASEEVAKAHINMLSGFENASSDAELGVWSFFADVSGMRDDLEALRRRLLALPAVKRVEIVLAEDGFMVDSQHFPVRVSNRRALVMRTEALSEMISHMWRVFGSGAATIIDQMAEAMGRYSAQELLDDYGKEFVLKNLVEVLHTYTSLGYAKIDVVRRNEPSSFTVHAAELFECEANAKKSLRRKSIFFRGHLRGFISTIHDADYEVTEAQCVAEGDETCSFVAARIERLTPRVPVPFEELN